MASKCATMSRAISVLKSVSSHGSLNSNVRIAHASIGRVLPYMYNQMGLSRFTS